MTSKEVKSALKEAREAIKSKNYSLAITKCNEILKEDANNYMALVMLGAAYQDTDKKEAAKHLKKAVSCNDDPTIALQGLANCADDEDLPDVLGQLIQLTPQKYSDLHAKLLVFSSKLTNLKSVFKIFEKEISSESSERVESALNCIATIYMKCTEDLEEFNGLIEKSLDYHLKTNFDCYHHEKYKKYLKLLCSMKDYKKLLQHSCIMHEKYGNDIYPLEWICKMFVDNVDDNSFVVQDNLVKNLSFYTEAALKLNPNSTLALVANGINLYREGNFVAARVALESVNELQPNWTICLNILVEIYMQLRAYSLAEKLYRQLKVENINLVKALIGQDKLLEAQKLLENKNDEEELVFLQAKISIFHNNYSEAEHLLQQLNDQSKRIMLNALIAKQTGDFESCIELLSTENSCDSFIELGKTFYQMENYDRSLLNFLKATKLESYNSECFYWLGKIYLKNNDELRAKKCFEKSLNLYPSNEDAVITLSTIYRKNAEWDSNIKLLENCVKSLDGPKSLWAHLQLALHHLAQQNYDEAITSFRTMIRYDVNNITSWEGLADAYMARGSYTSALKVFEKTSDFDPSNPYPRIQMGNIKNILHQHRDGLECFENLLKDHPKYFPAVKGAADSHAGLCYYRLSQRLIGRSRDHAQKAIDYLTEALKMKPNFVCLWKLLANLLDTIATFPKGKSFLEIEGSLAGVKYRKIAHLEGDKLFDLASKCYGRAINLCKDDHFLWYELSMNYYQRAATYCKENLDKKKEYLKLAMESVKYAIKLCPTKWQNWNLLGVIAANKDIGNLALAQHCFIKAIDLDKKTTAVSWSNLGVLYLIEGQTALANKAFGRSQQTDTTFMNAWIGQGIIAEQVGQGDEAMDLFRHCTQLGFHSESSLGYPHWVCSILDEKDYRMHKKYQYAIDHMYAIPVALDSINWHCAEKNDEASMEALCFMGYLNSCQGLCKQASAAYRQAAEKVVGVERDKILCDLGYSLLKGKRYEEAVDAFNLVSEASYIATVGKALAYFKASQFQESYTEYETALNWLAQSEFETAYVLIAMSAMVYAFQGEKEAKTLLFQCIALPEPPVESLFSACALGLLYSDTVLTDLVIKELKNHENDEKNGHNVVFLISQYYLLSKQKKLALNYLLSQVHKFPARAKLRHVLASHLLKKHRTSEKHLIFASRIAQSSLVLQLHDRKERSSSEDAAKSLAVASEVMRTVDQRERRILAQKAVHVNPTCKEAWSSLIACLN